MRLGDPFLFLAVVIAAAVAIAFPLAILIDSVRRRRKFRALVKHIERPNAKSAAILRAFGSVRAVDNVTPLTRKAVGK